MNNKIDNNPNFVKDRDTRDLQGKWIQLLGFKPRVKINQLNTLLGLPEIKMTLGSVTVNLLRLKKEAWERFYAEWIKPPKLAGTYEVKKEYALKILEFWKDPVKNLGVLWTHFNKEEKAEFMSRVKRQSYDLVECEIHKHIENLSGGETLLEESY